MIAAGVTSRGRRRTILRERRRSYTRVQLDDRVNNEGKTRVRRGVTPPPYIPSTVVELGDAPLFIVEGPPKALSLVSCGVPNAIGCGGVNAGILDKAGQIHEALRPFLRSTRPVYIVFDGGRTTNALVAKAEARLARAFIDAGCPTRVVELPLKSSGEDQGPDDFLAANGPLEFFERVLAARDAAPAAWAREVLAEGTAAARGLIDHLPFLASLELAGPKEQDDAAQVLSAIHSKSALRSARTDFRRQLRGKSAARGAKEEWLSVGDHVEVAKRYLSRLGTDAAFADGALHTYSAGVWTPIREADSIRDITKYSGFPVQSADGFVPLKLRDTDCKGVARIAYALVDDSRFFDAAPRGLAFNNGFLALEDGTLNLKPHSPDNRARHVYPFDFDSKAECKRWRQFLSEVWDNEPDLLEREAALQEFVGGCLFGVVPRYKKCLVLIGDTDSGKSTCLDVIREVFPEGTTTAVAPADWKNDYKRALLAGKLLNTVGELPERDWIETESFKAFVGEDPITCRQIYGVPFTYLSKAGHIFAANALPRVNDRTDATWNRFTVLTCNERFFRTPLLGQRKAQEGLARTIVAEEQAGIIAWAVEGLLRLVAQGHFTVPPTSLAAVATWKAGSDQLEEFFEDELVVAPGQNVPVRALYDRYRDWALRSGHQALASERFREQFTRLLVKRTGNKDPKYKSRGIMVYRGIKTRPVEIAETMLSTVEDAKPGPHPYTEFLSFGDFKPRRRAGAR